MTSDRTNLGRYTTGIGRIPVPTKDDPYQAYAATRAPAPNRRKQRHNEALAKVREERGELGKAYRAMRGHHIARTLARHDPAGNLAPFLETLRELSIDDAPILVEAVESAGWLIHGNAELRFLALQEIDQIIIAIREKAGLVPFDDPIDMRDANAFFQVKRLLRL